jgi:hypothetical protein
MPCSEPAISVNLYERGKLPSSVMAFSFEILNGLNSGADSSEGNTDITVTNVYLRIDAKVMQRMGTYTLTQQH